MRGSNDMLNPPFSRRVAILAACAVLSLACSAAPSTPHGHVTDGVRVGDGLYVFVNAGGNTVALMGDEGILIVDVREDAVVPRIRAVARALGHNDEVRYVVATHSHRDHVRGHGALAPETVIVAHDNAATRLSEPQVFRGQHVRAMAPAQRATATFAHSHTIELNGYEVELRHIQGAHTDGDTVAHFLDHNVVALGDAYFPGRFPYVDPDSGGDIESLERALRETLAELPADTVVIGGHFGPVSDIDELGAYLEMVTDTRAHVADQLAAGLTAPEILAAGLPEEFESYSWNLVDTALWIETILAAEPVVSVESSQD